MIEKRSKRVNNNTRGQGQVSEVRREANGVRISFTIDRWEAVATSSWASWLTGTRQAASLAIVQGIEREGNKLRLHCTGLALSSALRGLATRDYMKAGFPPRYMDEIEDDEDDWLDGFGEDEDTTAE